MAAGNSRELCSVCLERYDHDARPPVALLCGHSFCRPCLTSEWSSNSSVQCPNCSRIHEGVHPRDLPINYLLLSVLERVTDNREEPRVDDEHGEEEPKKKEYCKDTDSSDSDSEEEDFKGIKKAELIKEEKTDEKDKKRHDEAEDPILRSPIEDDKNHLILDISAEKSKPKTKKWYQRRGLLIPAVIVLAILMGLASCYLIAPTMLKNWGFTEEGVAPNSYATKLMSEETKSYGKTRKDSWVAWYQKAGRKGFDNATKALLFFAGFFIFLSISFAIYCVWFLYNYLKQKYKKYMEFVKQELPLTEETTSVS